MLVTKFENASAHCPNLSLKTQYNYAGCNGNLNFWQVRKIETHRSYLWVWNETPLFVRWIYIAQIDYRYVVVNEYQGWVFQFFKATRRWGVSISLQFVPRTWVKVLSIKLLFLHLCRLVGFLFILSSFPMSLIYCSTSKSYRRGFFRLSLVHNSLFYYMLRDGQFDDET